VSFTNELGKLVLTTDKAPFTVDLNAPDGDGKRYGDQFLNVDYDNYLTGNTLVVGSWQVPTIPVVTNNTQQAASTGFVQSAITYTIGYTTAIVHRAGLPPFVWPAASLYSAGDGSVIAHDLLVLRGSITGQFALRYGNFKVAAHDLAVNDAFIGARVAGEATDSATVDITGITVRGKFYVFASNGNATKPLLCTVRDAPYIAHVAPFQLTAGTQPDRHKFINCTIGRVYRDAAYASEPRHTMQFERCTIGVGVTSGPITDTYAANDMNAEYIGCIFRLSGTAGLGSTTQYGKNTFINCVVVAADGTITSLDNRPTVQSFNFQAADPAQEPGKVKQWVRPNGEVVIQGPTGAALILTTVGV
jgi:hypothetical protein